MDWCSAPEYKCLKQNGLLHTPDNGKFFKLIHTTNSGALLLMKYTHVMKTRASKLNSILFLHSDRFSEQSAFWEINLITTDLNK